MEHLTQTVEPWYYSGDVNALAYGGTWINTDGTNNEVIEAITSADLDSLSDDQVLVRTGYLFTDRPLREWRQVLRTCGWWHGAEWTRCDRTTRRGVLLEALNAYYGFDCSDEWTMAADEAAAFIVNRVPLAHSCPNGGPYREDMTTECAYCGHDVPGNGEEPTPAVDDDDAWDDLAPHHADDCEWIATRAHRIDA